MILFIMVKKKRGIKKRSFEKGLEKEIHEVEAWVKQRKKFFIRLAWVIGFIVVLLIVSNLYLKVNGVGI